VTSLIEETLGGWRDQAYSQDPVEGSVAEAMIKASILRPDRIRSRYPEAAARFGITAEPQFILGQLRNSIQRYRTAPAHGDLHGENVRVRNDHAIVIDLASVVAAAPLTVDLAALEPDIQRKAAAFKRWHEPDDARVSSPESVRDSG
jgi:hypothetical protein